MSSSLSNAEYISIFNEHEATGRTQPETTSRSTTLNILVKIWHMLAVIPKSIFRVATIASRLSVPEEMVTEELDSSSSCDLTDALRDLPHIIRSNLDECGNPACDSKQGTWVRSGTTKAYCLEGVKDAEVYVFQCRLCGSETGPTTTTLASGKQVIFFFTSFFFALTILVVVVVRSFTFSLPVGSTKTGKKTKR